MKDKKKLCGPCKHFQKKDYLFGWGCVKTGQQLGEMFPELCGKEKCAYFEERVKCGAEEGE